MFKRLHGKLSAPETQFHDFQHFPHKFFIRISRIRRQFSSSISIFSMATRVDVKLLRQTKFPPEFSHKVDMTKVNIEVMKK